MKAKAERKRRAPPAPKADVRRRDWRPLLVAGAALVAAIWAYAPALNGAFLFDDTALPFALPDAAAPFPTWVRGVRPVLMASYWLNARISGDDPFSYHVVSLMIHLAAAALVFVIVRRLLEWSQAPAARRTLLAGFAGGLFLLHPVQTEAVAYLAGRSEALSVTMVLAAYAVFLYRRQAAIGWGTMLLVLALFGLAVLSKEHTIVLPALLLLTDFWWNPGFSLRGARANWRLYAPLALGAAGAVTLFWKVILYSPSAGFSLRGVSWYQYLFTQGRALFVYPAEFLLPVRLTADWDFPVSHGVFDHGAIFGLVALVALAAAAWHYRRRFPLACFGFFAYLVLMSPTSSILPIADPLAERRLYLGMLGLLLIVVDLAGRIRTDSRKLAAALVAVLLVGRDDHACARGSLGGPGCAMAGYGVEIATQAARVVSTGERIRRRGPLPGRGRGIPEGGASLAAGLRSAGGLGAGLRLREPAGPGSGKAAGGCEHGDRPRTCTRRSP